MSLMQFIPLADLLSSEPPKNFLRPVSFVNLHTSLYALMQVSIDLKDTNNSIFELAFESLKTYTIGYDTLKDNHFDINWPLDTDYDSVLNYAQMLLIIKNGGTLSHLEIS